MSPLSTFFIARHGETEWNRLGRFQGGTDIALNETGRAQAADLAARLTGRIDCIATSPLARAAETAAIVGRILGVASVEVDDDLRERDYGVFEGLTRAECAFRYPEIWSAYEREGRVEPPGSEPRDDVARRVARAFARRVEKSDRSPTLVVSHGAAIRVFLEVVTGQPIARIGNAVVHRVGHDGARFRYLGLL